MSAREPDVCGVVVDEVKLRAVASPALGWWAEQAMRLERAGRAVVVDIALPGAILHIRTEDRDEAEWMREHLISKGMLPKAVTVKTLASARKKIRDRHARADGPDHTCGYCDPAEESAHA